MWIKRIKLKNFKSYAEAEFEFPAPEQGRNLVLWRGNSKRPLILHK